MERCSQHLTFESFALSVQEKIESQGHRAKKKEREGERDSWIGATEAEGQRVGWIDWWSDAST